MSREDEFKAILLDDSGVTAIVSDRIFTSSEVGPNGLSQEVSPAIYDDDGNLLTSLLIRQRDLIPDGQVDDRQYQRLSLRQAVEIYAYQESGYDDIDEVLLRCIIVLFGKVIEDSFELEFIGTLDRLRDEGALAGASMARQDWLVTSVL